MIGGVLSFCGEGSVQGNHLTFACKFCEGGRLTFGRVAVEGAKSFGAESVRNGRSHVPYTHDTHAGVLGVGRKMTSEDGAPKTIADILCHTLCIAPWAIAPFDASLRKIFLVKVIVSDGGGHHELHLTAFEQGFISMCACAYDECIGILYICRSNLRSRTINTRAELFGKAVNKRDLIVNNEFHRLFY